MFVRLVFAPLCVASIFFARERSAHAEPAPRAVWRTVPPAPADTTSGFAASVDRLLASCRSSPFAMQGRGGDALGRDAATSLGARPRGVHLGGASLAAIGLGAWTLSRGMFPNLTFGPRLYGGGAGLGFTLRW